MKKTEEKKSRKELELEQRKAYILSRAEELFAEYGFKNTSMAMIAEKSEFSVGTVYNFFPSKHDIYSELIISKMTSVLDNVSKIAKKDINPLEKIRELFYFNVTTFLENRRFMKIYVDDITRHEWGMPSNFSDTEKKMVARLENVLDSIILEAQRKGYVRDDISSDRITIVFRKINKSFMLSILQDEIREPALVADEVFDILMNGIGAKK